MRVGLFYYGESEHLCFIRKGVKVFKYKGRWLSVKRAMKRGGFFVD